MDVDRSNKMHFKAQREFLSDSVLGSGAAFRKSRKGGGGKIFLIPKKSNFIGQKSGTPEQKSE